jgi:hypothetical protein
MEGQTKRVAPLRLERFVPQHDVRRLIWQHLTVHDREVMRCAMNPLYEPDLGLDFVRYCVVHGFASLLLWAQTSGGAPCERHHIAWAYKNLARMHGRRLKLLNG